MKLLFQILILRTRCKFLEFNLSDLYNKILCTQSGLKLLKQDVQLSRDNSNTTNYTNCVSSPGPNSHTIALV